MDDKLFPGSASAASFVAIGDSFTEGLNDPATDGGFRGWADRLAGLLAAGYPDLRYANLAVRGKLLREIVAEQVPAAVAMSPALVSIAGGGNDILRPGGDPDTLAELFDAAVARLRQAGCRVLVFTGFDPVGIPLLRLLRGRIAAYNMHLRAIADDRGCDLVDLWSMRFMRDMGAWSEDRLHLSPESHQRIALRACEVLGVHVTADLRASSMDTTGAADPGSGGLEVAVKTLAGAGTVTGALARPGVARAAWLAARRQDARWARQYLLPWVNRRLHHTSSGDGLLPKRPELLPVIPAGHDRVSLLVL
ncbi:MAG TPA: SGNH/GDSL hydrolase family protein [Trebonia sp.]|jgi:lysophospholipase L1-like esterase